MKLDLTKKKENDDASTLFRSFVPNKTTGKKKSLCSKLALDYLKRLVHRALDQINTAIRDYQVTIYKAVKKEIGTSPVTKYCFSFMLKSISFKT